MVVRWGHTKEVGVIAKSSGGIGLGGALFITFLVLKLCGVVSWSWVWVTAPLWIPFCVVALILAIAALIAAIEG